MLNNLKEDTGWVKTYMWPWGKQMHGDTSLFFFIHKKGGEALARNMTKKERRRYGKKSNPQGSFTGDF